MTFGYTVCTSGPLDDSRRFRPVQATTDTRPELSPTEKLWRAREHRYVRDREELFASLSRCTEEPSVEKLQTLALEQVKAELEDRIVDHDRRAQEVRDRLAGQSGANDDSRESLLRQRLMVEHGLAQSREELAVVNRELDRLRHGACSSRANSIEWSSSCSQSVSRSATNLSLFLQNSPTRRPLPKSTRPYSADYIRRAGSSRPREFDRVATHLRSKSLMKNFSEDKFYAKSDQSIRPTSSTRNIAPGISSGPTSNSRSARLVPVVDEFNNSFSSRVIAPSSSHPRPRSSLRNLQMTSTERRRVFANRSRRSSMDRSEYGNITLLPREIPRPSMELPDDLPDIPLPSYVHNLMSEFEQVSQPSLDFNLMDDKIPDTPIRRKLPPLSPVLEQASPSVKSQLSAKSAGRKLLKKQSPIFTLRLPARPPAPGSSSLAASSSTSIDISSDEHPLSVPLLDSPIPLRPKGLPSTRNHDLAMLDAAPDDLSETPLRHEPMPPTTMKRTSRSFAALRRVKSRLIQLGRF